MGQSITLVQQFGAPTFTSLRTIGNTTVGNNLTVSGSITAQSLIVNTTSYYSGSTQFGTIVSDTHQFTGSIFNSGSITTIGQYNGSGAGLTSIPNSATTATNANTANTIVTRDASGNFTAGTITATLSGNASTATTATTVTTNANLTGNVTSVGNATTIAAGVVTSAMIVDGTIVNGDINASAAIVDTKLSTISTAGKVSNSATTATSANTVSAIVARDGSGNFTAGTITATFSGNVTGDISGNSATTSQRTFGYVKTDGLTQGSYGSISIGGSTNFYGGINFSDVTMTLMAGIGASGFYYNNTTWRGYWDSAGTLQNTGDVIAYASDKRLKTNIVNIPNALNKICSINGVTFDWKLDECAKWNFTPPKNDIGVIAQEIQEICPEAVTFAPFDRDPVLGDFSKSGENYLTVKYEKLVPLLIEAIKEQQAQIEELKAKIG